MCKTDIHELKLDREFDSIINGDSLPTLRCPNEVFISNYYFENEENENEISQDNERDEHLKKNKKIDNLYYTGQLTVPGPGVPPSIISGQIVAIEMDKHLKKAS